DSAGNDMLNLFLECGRFARGRGSPGVLVRRGRLLTDWAELDRRGGRVELGTPDAAQAWRCRPAGTGQVADQGVDVVVHVSRRQQVRIGRECDIEAEAPRGR